MAPDLYSFKVSDFDADQTREQTENAIGYVLQTPEAYLAANGVAWDLPPSSENESPVDFPHPGPDGLVHAPVIQKGLTEELDKLALKAMTFWRLRPVSDGSRAVAARVPVQISFHLL